MGETLPPGHHGYLWTVTHQRCPKCTRGLVYGHAMNMNTLCPACGSRFEREPGYFTGAIYIGILLALPVVLLALYLLMRFVPEIPLQLSALLAVLAFAPLLPLTLRISRVMWLGIGHDFSPDDSPGLPPDPPGSVPETIDPTPGDGTTIDTPPEGNLQEQAGTSREHDRQLLLSNTSST